jgi:hypothetical protein
MNDCPTTEPGLLPAPAFSLLRTNAFKIKPLDAVRPLAQRVAGEALRSADRQAGLAAETRELSGDGDSSFRGRRGSSPKCLIYRC